MVVVSRLGVYANHLWESPTFTVDDDFDWEVKEMVPNGDPDQPNIMPALSPLATGSGQPFVIDGARDWAGLTDGNKVQTFVITPRSPTGSLLYPDKVAWIESYLRRTFPSAHPKTIAYEPLDEPPEGDPEAHNSTPRGKILFQYDPNVGTDTVAGCDRPLAGLRLYVMEHPEPVYTDKWVAAEERAGGVVGKRSLHQRQDGGSGTCRGSASSPSSQTSFLTDGISTDSACNLDVYQIIRGSSAPLLSEMRNFDAEKEFLAYDLESVAWGVVNTVTADDSQLPWDVSITFTQDIVSFGSSGQGKRNYTVYAVAVDSGTSPSPREDVTISATSCRGVRSKDGGMPFLGMICER